MAHSSTTPPWLDQPREWGPSPQAGHSPPAARDPSPGAGFGKAAVVAGILGLVIPVIGSVVAAALGSAAIVAHLVGRPKQRLGPGSGAILGLIGIGLAVAGIIFWGVFIGRAGTH